ncbi:MAG: hypothetical protein LBK54_11410 [Propionibacteriaceae bacterium]|nr:hypothetical protein [Propionibacteriaceae bacterium]
MPEINSKEQAESYVFAQNIQQSKIYNSFNLYTIPIIGLLIAVLAFFVGEAERMPIGIVLAFVQAACALGGLAFAIWSSETKRNRVANTYLTQTGLMFEVATLLLCLVMLGLNLLSPKIPVLLYPVPWLIYAATFFITYLVLHAKVGAHEHKVSRTTSFATLIVVVLVGVFINRVITVSTADFMDNLSASGTGLVLLGAGSLMALILGLLTATGFYKNLLVKKYDIDLSRLYIDA